VLLKESSSVVGPHFLVKLSQGTSGLQDRCTESKGHNKQQQHSQTT